MVTCLAVSLPWLNSPLPYGVFSEITSYTNSSLANPCLKVCLWGNPAKQTTLLPHLKLFIGSCGSWDKVQSPSCDPHSALINSAPTPSPTKPSLLTEQVDPSDGFPVSSPSPVLPPLSGIFTLHPD